ncbi:ankyrin repeat domain-containing protein [Paenibacillus amylolyticus]|nr:ankyrin repeat domain-containing protein [Paenibacillus amylolyticus]WFR61143.1 ankyrin repeat domain-containing protein [Paenibacillus amylolyticus]
MISLEEQLFKTVKDRDNENIQKWIQAGANINARDQNGQTAAMIATYNNDLISAKALIKAGADVNIQDCDGVSPLSHAKSRGFREIEDILIHAGAR